MFNRDEQRVLDLLLLELMKQFARKTTGSKKVFEKFIEQLENAVAYKSDVFFG